MNFVEILNIVLFDLSRVVFVVDDMDSLRIPRSSLLSRLSNERFRRLRSNRTIYSFGICCVFLQHAREVRMQSGGDFFDRTATTNRSDLLFSEKETRETHCQYATNLLSLKIYIYENAGNGRSRYAYVNQESSSVLAIADFIVRVQKF